MNTLQVTDEQLKAIAEALQIAASLAARRDDEEAFAYFNLEDLLVEQNPQLSGMEWSEHFTRSL